MPQRPITTLGTAASMSISEPIGPRIAAGASSLRKRPIAIESGAAIRIAPNEVTTRADDELARAVTRSVHAGSTSLCQMNEMPNLLHRRPGACRRRCHMIAG